MLPAYGTARKLNLDISPQIEVLVGRLIVEGETIFTIAGGIVLGVLALYALPFLLAGVVYLL